MANFDSTYSAKQASVDQSTDLLNQVRALYVRAKAMQAMLALYTAGTNAAFNAGVNAIYTASERAELQTMQNQVNALITDWEANHQAAIGLGG